MRADYRLTQEPSKPPVLELTFTLPDQPSLTYGYVNHIDVRRLGESIIGAADFLEFKGGPVVRPAPKSDERLLRAISLLRLAVNGRINDEWLQAVRTFLEEPI